MRPYIFLLLAALSASGQSSIPPLVALNIDMPPREFAPAVLVFFAEPYGSIQSQNVSVNSLENGLYQEVRLSPDPACQTWLSVPYPRQAPTGLAVWPGASGTYTCRVSITRGGKLLGALTVYLNVGSARAGTTPGIAAPTALTFVNLGEPQTVTVNGRAYYATIVRASVDTGFAGGAYGLVTMSPGDGKVTVRGDNRTRGPQQLYIETPSGTEVVRIALLDNSPITVHPATVNLSVQAASPVPDAQFTVTGGIEGLPLTVTSSAGWVKVTAPAEAFTPATYTLSFDTSLLPNGLNTATITIRTPTFAAPLTLPVVLLVSGSNVAPGTLSLTPVSLSFTATAGGPQPAPQAIAVTAAAPASYTGTATTQTGGAWLRVVPPGSLSTTTNPTVQVGVDTTGLAAGNYTGSIVFTVPGTSFSRGVPVTLVISAPAPSGVPTISAVPSSLTFTYRSGAALPNPGTLQVAGTAGLPFSAQASSDGDWLVVTPSSGTISPTTAFAVSINEKAATLAPGPHSGSVTLSVSGGPSTTVRVALSVAPPLPAIARVVNAASYAAGPIAAGEMITIFGDHLGPAAGQSLALDSAGRVARNVGGVEVLIAGFLAPILYASERQVSAIVPYEIAAPFIVAPDVVVRYGGQSSSAFTTAQASAAPAIFSADSSGAGHAAALNADFSGNSATRPAAAGEILQLFLTGEGLTSPSGVTGRITTVSSEGPLTPQPILRVSATIDGLPAKLWYYGEAPGIVAGMMQINVEVPAGVRAGESAVEVTLGSGADAHTTQSGVTVSIR